MTTMKRVKMMLSTPKAFEGNVLAYIEKEPTTPARLHVSVRCVE